MVSGELRDLSSGSGVLRQRIPPRAALLTRARNGIFTFHTKRASRLYAEVRAKIDIYEGKVDVIRGRGDGMAFVRLCQFLRGHEESRCAADPVMWGDADASCREF